MKNELVKSIGFNQQEILSGIMRFYCPEGFEVDVTYNTEPNIQGKS